MDEQLQQAVSALKAAHAAGDTENATKLANYINNYQAVPEPKPTPETYGQQVAKIPSLIPEMITSLGGRITERVSQYQPTMEERIKDPALAARKSSNIPGLAAGLVTDVLDEGFGLALNTVGLLIPDSIDQPIKQFVADNARKFLTTDAGQAVVTALEGGAESYAAWKKENPMDARDFESVVNAGLLFTPKVDASPVSNFIGKSGTLLEESGKKSIARSKRNFVNRLIEPEQTRDVKQEALGRTDVSPILQTATVRQTADEVETAEILMGIKGVGYQSTLKNNWNKIHEDIGKRSEKLINDLETFETNRMKATGATGRLERPEVVDRLKADIVELMDTNPLIRGKESLQKTTQALLDKTVELLDGKPLTPANLIRARRELDDFILKNKGTVFDAADENALNVPFRRIRQTLNDIVNEQVPSASVKKSLREQTLLYGALDNIAPKAADEASTILGRTVQNIKEVIPYQDQRGLWLGTAAVTAGGVTFPELIPYMAGGVVLTGLARQLRGSAAYGKTKAQLGNMLRYTDRAIKASRNTAMIKQLKADRVYIANLLEELGTAPPEEGTADNVPELIAKPL